MRKQQVKAFFLCAIFMISISLGASLVPIVSAASSTNQAVDPTKNLKATFFIKNKNSGKYLDVKGGKPTNGANLIQWSFTGKQNQQWKLVEKSNGTYQIVSLLSGNPVIDIAGKSSKNGANAQIWKSSQTFQVVKVSNGNYKLESAVSGKARKVLTVQGASKKMVPMSCNGRLGKVATISGSSNQWATRMMRPPTIKRSSPKAI